MIEWIKEAGYEASAIMFPHTMNKSQIAFAMLARIEEIKDSFLLTDWTCHDCLEYKLQKSYSIKTSWKGLDNFCSSALEIVCGMKGVDCPPSEHLTMQEDIDEDGSVAKNLLQRIFNQGTIPEKIFVITEKAGDHEPFSYGWKSENPINGGDTERFEFDRKIAAPVIASWFSEIFGQDKVEIVSPYINWTTANWENKQIDWEIIQKIDQPNSWVIYDRHLMGTLIKSKVKFHQTKELRIPLSNFFTDVHELDLLDLKAELSAIDQQIKKLLLDCLARG
jgi:hypothetical protein